MSTQRPSSSPPSVPPPTILHVDDDEANRYAVTRSLVKAGFTVTEAADGTTALRLAAGRPDLIILDVRLPDIDGFEVCRRLKADARTADVPVLHLSASLTTGEAKAHGLDGGADAYLVRPVEPVELVATVRALLRARASEEALRASEAQLRLVMSSIKDHAIFTLALDGTITAWNVGAERMFGYDTGEVLGRSADGLFTPEDRAAGRPAEEMQLAAVGGVAEDTRPHVRKGGEHFFALGSMEALRDGAGQLLGYVKVVRDVTERRRAEQAVRESEQRFRALVTASSEVLYRLSPDWGELRQLNGGRFVPDAARPSRRWMMDYIPAEEHPRVNAAIDEAIRSKGLFRLEHRVRRDDGTVGWALSRAVPLLDETGQVIEWFGTATDTTERRRAEEGRQALLEREQAARTQAEAAAAEAERAGRMKDEFLATLSHELRTPLNAILGWATIIRDGGFDADDVRQGTEVIERNARAQGQIIEDLLDMSRIISGTIRLDVGRVDLPAVVRAAVDAVRPAATAKAVRLHSVLDPLADLAVSGDAGRLQQVFWNLLTNAVKFTPKGGHVQVVLARAASHVEVSVSDSGEGIAAEFLPHVFDRFRQADASTTRRHGGLGLGLSIVKQLVDLHGGSVAVASDGPGRGTRFAVELPLVAVQPEPAEADVARRHARARAPCRPRSAMPPAGDVAGLRVLVVDDEPDARDVVRRLLAAAGATVTATGSVDEAVTLAGTAAFDVLVSDVGMPGQDGYALIRRVRGLAQGGAVPAIALTAYARVEGPRQGRRRRLPAARGQAGRRDRTADDGRRRRRPRGAVRARADRGTSSRWRRRSTPIVPGWDARRCRGLRPGAATR